jgi:hypothetical protein
MVLLPVWLSSVLPLLLSLLTAHRTTAQLEPCRNNAHVNGSWVASPNATKSFVCCGGSNRFTPAAGNHSANDFTDPAVQATCGQQNTVASYLEVGLTAGNSAQCGDDCCRCDRDDGTRFVPGSREKYTWTPTQCELTVWNSTLFCSLLGNRTVLLVGDSTMQQTASTLMSMVAVGGGECGPQITFGRSDFVGFSARQQHSFPELCDRYNPQIAIIALGAHIADEGDFYDMHRRVITHLETRTARGLARPRVIFKSVNPPHLSCSQFTAPEVSFEIDPGAEDKYKFKTLYLLDKVATLSYFHLPTDRLNPRTVTLSLAVLYPAYPPSHAIPSLPFSLPSPLPFPPSHLHPTKPPPHLTHPPPTDYARLRRQRNLRLPATLDGAPVPPT